MIWDRRSASRQTCSQMYLESVDRVEVPFGCVLKINKAISSERNAYIRSLRFYREKPGHLGVLSSAGELQVYCMQKQYLEPNPENEVDGSPELLQVQKSHPIRYSFFDELSGYHPDERVVSFDWMTLGSTDYQPRIVTRDCRQSLDVRLLPSTTQHLASKLINFSGRARCMYSTPKKTSFFDRNSPRTIQVPEVRRSSRN
jgi:hypothetical protein